MLRPTFLALALWLSAMSASAESKDQAHLAEFLADAFRAEVRATRHHRLTDDWLFGDSSSLWEVEFESDQQDDVADLDLLSPGRYLADREFFEAELTRAWPDVSREELSAYSFFRGDLPLTDGPQHGEAGCGYYLVSGVSRAFVGILCS